MKIAVVIPSYAGDLDKIPNMLKSIAAQTRQPDLVILRISSVEAAPVYKTPFPLTVMTTSIKQSAAQNRNAGATAVPEEYDIVSFFDSDDWMHPRRIEYIERAFQEPVDVVLHSMFCKREDEFDTWPMVSYYFYEKCCFLNEEGNRCFISINGYRKDAQAGHLSVRRTVLEDTFFPVTESTIGFEDTLFLVNLHKLGFSFGFIDAQLSLYMQFSPQVRFEKDSVLYQLRGELIDTHTESVC